MKDRMNMERDCLGMLTEVRNTSIR